MSYIVYFKGKGYTAPNGKNPKGLRVIGTGKVVVEGDKPADGFKIPFEVIQRCKDAFMKECHCVRYDGDKPGWECFPQVKLGKAIEKEAA